jgi:hypothetical protein
MIEKKRCRLQQATSNLQRRPLGNWFLAIGARLPIRSPYRWRIAMEWRHHQA